MRVELRTEPGSETVAQRWSEALEAAGVADGEPEAVALVGSSRFFLRELTTLDSSRPILLVSGRGLGALSEVAPTMLQDAAERLASGAYWTEAVIRLRVRFNGREELVLNDAVLLPQVNGTFMTYELRVDGELLWRDRGDGVILSTPIGSTAYALASGGAAMLTAARTLEVVPICSEESLPPLVVPEDGRVTLSQPEAEGGVQIVLDGHQRERVTGDVEAAVDLPPLHLLRLRERRHGAVLSRLRFRREGPRELLDAPPSARFIYKLLEYEGPLTPGQLARLSALSPRTVRYALEDLRERGLVVQRASLRDTRSHVYELAPVHGEPRPHKD